MLEYEKKFHAPIITSSQTPPSYEPAMLFLHLINTKMMHLEGLPLTLRSPSSYEPDLNINQPSLIDVPCSNTSIDANFSFSELPSLKYSTSQVARWETPHCLPWPIVLILKSNHYLVGTLNCPSPQRSSVSEAVFSVLMDDDGLESSSRNVLRWGTRR